MFRLAFTAVAFVTISSSLSAQEPIRFARTPDISPDGKLVAFSYLGDIWTVEAIGGVARPPRAIWPAEASGAVPPPGPMPGPHDTTPVSSPAGNPLASRPNRHGSYDVFVVPAVGGKPKRLTFDSGNDMVLGWTPDGKS